MANPQIEDGHVDIAHELIEALAGIRISGEETQCLWVIFRKTYGWHKKSDRIALSQFCKLTKMKKQACSRALIKLAGKKIITVNKNDDCQINSYSINKNFEEWKPSTKKMTVNNIDKALSTILITGVNNIDKETVNKKDDYKRNYTKETNTKETNTCAEQEKPCSLPTEILIPLKNGDGEFKINQEDVENWKNTFPAVDVMQELREICLWNRDNPKKRKTKSGIRRHISGWLAKEQEKEKANGQQPNQLNSRNTQNEKKWGWQPKSVLPPGM